MTYIKICGITNLEDALMAVEVGADALGFNFYPGSPRYIEPKAARRIVDQLPAETLTVGVFVNEPTPLRVEEMAIEAGVRALQLHGDETPMFCRALDSRFTIKVLTAHEGLNIQSALEYPVQAILLDSFDDKRRGGTGLVNDWSLAKRVRELVPSLFLAGGLSPENVAEAIEAVHPYAVDACSALEIRPGKKSRQRVLAFVNAARSPVKH